MDDLPENGLITIPAKAPLKAGGIQSPSLVSPFGKGGLREISLHSWIPDQVRHGTVGYAAYVKVNFHTSWCWLEARMDDYPENRPFCLYPSPSDSSPQGARKVGERERIFS
jgi:hypothetical protein